MSEVNKPQGRKPLCIIGTATSSADAPYDLKIDDDYMYDIWGINTALVKEDVKRLDICFEMHPKRYWGKLPVLERLNNFKKPVYMQDHYKDIPNSKPYPREAIKEKYQWEPMGEKFYATNTIVYMFLMALEEGYTDISLYGIHMSHNTEYAYQRACVSWALGIVHGYILCGKKYKITIPEESALLKAEYEYGYEEPTRAMEYLQGRQAGMKKGIDEAQAQIKNLQSSVDKTIGAQSEAKLMYEKMAGWM